MILPPQAVTLPEHLIDSAVILPQRNAILPMLPKQAVFAEVGVATGDFSQLVMSACQTREFIAIDTFQLHDIPILWGQPSEVLLKGKTHVDAYRARFISEINNGKMRVMVGDSVNCLEQLDDNSIDVIYIDADHRYEGVKRDLDMAIRKVRHDGWIIVNDYLMVDQLGATEAYGVVNATNEFMIEHNWGMQYFALETRMFCDVALRRACFIPNPNACSTTIASENEKLRYELEVLRNSTSWKMTAPIRAVLRCISVILSAFTKHL